MSTTRTLVNGDPAGNPLSDDPGLTRGLNVFDTLRTYGTTPFRLEAHLTRLEASALAMGMPAPDLALIAREVMAVVGPDVQIRVTLTWGGHRVVHAAPLDLSYVGRPLSLARVELEPPPWLPGTVKHGSRAAWNVAAAQAGAQEILMVDRQGFALEANRSNLFAVLDGRLHTPPDDGRILRGVTRAALLEAAAEVGLPVEVAPLSARAPFEELYVSSTLKELAPVSTLDGVPVGGGPIGARLHAALRDLIRRETSHIHQ